MPKGNLKRRLSEGPDETPVWGFPPKRVPGKERGETIRHGGGGMAGADQTEKGASLSTQRGLGGKERGESLRAKRRERGTISKYTSRREKRL